VTAGLFADPAAILDLDGCQRMDVEIAKRPTGGGVLFHGADLSFSIFLPGSPMQGSVEECCQQINAHVIAALRPYGPSEYKGEVVCSRHRTGFCMSQVTAFDLVWNGKKIGGCAMRKTRHGMLHQTSIFLTSPDWGTIAQCVKDRESVREMQQTSVSLDHLLNQQIPREVLQESIITSFMEWRKA
jgi:lipoate-protein ligase A